MSSAILLLQLGTKVAGVGLPTFMPEFGVSFPEVQ
ncbi:hypothetical protein GGD46_005087 [Rhizobium lusitanum]|uniref:Uncharacterized protein n=1 Tax=Rhizobium lusitanum TaxID=293958 RepID=A0A7X0MEB3_9HYPH|nr:hypothetical protein [Rhizobium lusitanum]